MATKENDVQTGGPNTKKPSSANAGSHDTKQDISQPLSDSSDTNEEGNGNRKRQRDATGSETSSEEQHNRRLKLQSPSVEDGDGTSVKADDGQQHVAETRDRPLIRESRIQDDPLTADDKEEESIKVRLELDLEAEVDLKARVKGDVTIGLLE